jgi:KUP system potassium uptake protein
MLLTTALLYHVMRERWGWSVPTALAVGAIFITVDFALFAANFIKIAEGGWVPLGFGLVVFSVMTTWHYGVEALRAHHGVVAMPLKLFFEKVREMNTPRVPGTAIFLTRVADTTPPLLIRHVEQIGALQQTVVALAVKFAEVPRIPRRRRLEIKNLSDGFWQISAHFGFVQIPNLHAALRQARESGCPVDLEHAIFFSARDAVVARRSHCILLRARVMLFAFMLRNSVRPVDLFLIPTDNFIEVGRQAEI